MIIIKNGALVTPQGLRRADLAMEGDKIVRIAAAIEPGEGDTVQDATDCWVFPGFIDGHTHMQCWTGMDWTADSFETGTRAAACGGTTTIVDYATADRGVTMPDALAEWHRRADGTCTANYAFIWHSPSGTSATAPIFRPCARRAFRRLRPTLPTTTCAWTMPRHSRCSRSLAYWRHTVRALRERYAGE